MKYYQLNNSHWVCQENGEDFFVPALDGPLQWRVASTILGIWVGMVLQEEAGNLGHALAGPGSLPHTH